MYCVGIEKKNNIKLKLLMILYTGVNHANLNKTNASRRRKNVLSKKSTPYFYYICSLCLAVISVANVKLT